MSATKLISAVGYLRKSTKGETADGHERQEKSMPQQRKEIELLAKGKYEIKGDADWYADPGISGWKRGAQRPDFQRMLDRAREHRDFEAILCDNIDRFSRASVDEVQEDALALKRAGVRWIVTPAQGIFDLGRSGHDIGEIMKFVVAVWSAHEYSRQLSRRIGLARRNRAIEGKRSGGEAPYGMENDKHGGLTWGDPKRVKVVRMIFDWFVNGLKSMSWITGELNRQKIPARQGGLWYVHTVKQLLKRREYAGWFTYNKRSCGQFFHCNDKHEIVETEDQKDADSEARLFLKKGAYRPMIPQKLFDAAQQRLAGFATSGRRPREGGFALTNVLICDHCGAGFVGNQPTGRRGRFYTCPTNIRHGGGRCGNYRIAEAKILPFVLKVLGEEIEKLDLPLQPPKCPIELRPSKDHRAQIEKDITDLDAKIDQADTNVMFVSNPESRESIDRKIIALRRERKRLEAELKTDPDDAKEVEYLRMREVLAWWRKVGWKQIVDVPLPTKKGGKPKDIQASYRAINEALVALGCQIRLRWKTEKVTLKTGKLRNKYTLLRGRLRLGQRDVMFRNPRPVTN